MLPGIKMATSDTLCAEWPFRGLIAGTPGDRSKRLHYITALPRLQEVARRGAPSGTFTDAGCLTVFPDRPDFLEA